MITGWGWAAFLAVGAVLANAACEGFQEMAALQRELSEEFQMPEVVVALATDGGLTVTLQNPFPETEEQATCRRIAEFVRDHFVGYGELNTVRVAFATQRKVAGLSVTKTRIACSFTRDELGEAAPAVTTTASPSSTQSAAHAADGPIGHRLPLGRHPPSAR